MVIASPIIAFSVKYGLLLMLLMVALIVFACVWGRIRRKKILKEILDVPAEVDKRYLKESDFNELLKLLENKWVVSIPFTELYITEESVIELRCMGFRILG